jgi:hypothetical protein
MTAIQLRITVLKILYNMLTTKLQLCVLKCSTLVRLLHQYITSALNMLNE